MRAFVPGLCISVATVLFSCNNDASLIGSDFFNGSAVTMVTVDTLTLQTSTIKFDSLLTNDAARLMIGYHQDEDLGALSVGNYFQLSLGNAFILDKRFTEYLSSELRLIPDGYSYYDTLENVSFNVHKVTEAIQSKSGYLYNTTKFKYDPEPMASVNIKVRPHIKDTVKIKTTDDVGREFLRLNQAGASQMASIANFINYFHGLTLVPTTTSGPIVGFALNAEFRVYYVDKSVTPGHVRYLSFPLNTIVKYNTIKSDRTGTPFDALTSQTAHLNSNLTDNKVYVQSGTGLAMRVEVPYLREMLLQNAGLTVVNAVLEIYPTKSNRSENLTLPSELVVSEVNYKNSLIQTYAQKGIYKEDFYLGRDTHYEADVTNYVNSQMATEETNHNALVFTANDATFRGTVNRLYAGDQKNERQMVLKISFLSYIK